MSNQTSSSRSNDNDNEQDAFLNALTGGLPKQIKKTDKNKGLVKHNTTRSLPPPNPPVDTPAVHSQPPPPPPPEVPPIPTDDNDNDYDHFDSAGILTQFIGPRIMTTSSNLVASTEEDKDTTKIAKEIET